MKNAVTVVLCVALVSSLLWANNLKKNLASTEFELALVQAGMEIRGDGDGRFAIYSLRGKFRVTVSLPVNQSYGLGDRCRKGYGQLYLLYNESSQIESVAEKLVSIPGTRKERHKFDWSIFMDNEDIFRKKETREFVSQIIGDVIPKPM